MTTPNQTPVSSTLPNPNLVGSLGSKRQTGGGEYFAPGGNYTARIQQCKWIKQRDGKEAFIAECEVVHSDVDACAPGRKPSWYQSMSNDAGEGALGDFLRIALTILAARDGETLDPNNDDFWQETINYELLCEVVGEPNILAGVEIGLYTKPIKTKANKDFTVHMWSIPE